MEAKDVIQSLGALAQDTRLAAYRLLVRAGPQGLAAGRLAELLAVAPSNLSFHLSHLQHAGLVAVERQGRSMIYRADFERMSRLLGFLTAHCCAGVNDLTPGEAGRDEAGAEQARALS